MSSSSPSEFSHFIEAQSSVYDRAIHELSAGEKRSHCMWFILPQLKGLGFSLTSQKFALHSLEQAGRYLSHPVLGKRLRECTQLVMDTRSRPAEDIFGYPDYPKSHSFMTLFALATSNEMLFKQALQKYFSGKKDAKTLELLSHSSPQK